MPLMTFISEIIRTFLESCVAVYLRDYTSKNDDSERKSCHIRIKICVQKVKT